VEASYSLCAFATLCLCFSLQSSAVSSQPSARSKFVAIEPSCQGLFKIDSIFTSRFQQSPCETCMITALCRKVLPQFARACSERGISSGVDIVMPGFTRMPRAAATPNLCDDGVHCSHANVQASARTYRAMFRKISGLIVSAVSVG